MKSIRCKLDDDDKDDHSIAISKPLLTHGIFNNELYPMIIYSPVGRRAVSTCRWTQLDLHWLARNTTNMHTNMNRIKLRKLVKSFICLFLVTIQISFVITLSIVSPSSNQSKQNNQVNNVRSTSPSKESTTTLPPLLDTITQDPNDERINSSKDQRFAEHQHLQQHQYNEDGAKLRRSSNEDHDESVPLATINNHSRNNQQPIRPPQYVDVAALVGVSQWVSEVR